VKLFTHYFKLPRALLHMFLFFFGSRATIIVTDAFPRFGTLRLFFGCCYAATQLALQLHQVRLQVVCSIKEARKRLTELNGTLLQILAPNDTRLIPRWLSMTVPQSLPAKRTSPPSLGKTRQNGRKMTSFRGAMAKLGAGVDNELGGSAPHQCR